MKKNQTGRFSTAFYQIKQTISVLAIVCFAFGFTGCGSKSASEGHGEEEGHEHGSHENASTATLTSEQMKAIGLQLSSVEKKQLTASLKANGILKVPNQNKAAASTLQGGIIEAIKVQPGDVVQKGQVIATLSNTLFITMQEELLQVSAKLELAELEQKRQQDLQAGNASALKVLQQANAEVQLLKARKASLRKQLEILGISTANLSPATIQGSIPVLSPLGGSVSNVLVNVGTVIAANNPIAEMVDNSQLHLDLYVYEKDLDKVKVGQTIHFTLTNRPGKEYDARIYGISNTFEASTKAIAVHARVEGNKEGLIDGMSITALVSLEKAEVPALPTEAIVSFEGQDYILVATDPHSEAEHHDHVEGDGHKHDEQGHQHEEKGHDHSEKEEPAVHGKEPEGMTFERIPIRKGTTEVGYSEVTLLREIPADAKIVTKGAFFVLAKMTNQGEGHEH